MVPTVNNAARSDLFRTYSTENSWVSALLESYNRCNLNRLLLRRFEKQVDSVRVVSDIHASEKRAACFLFSTFS